MALAKLFVRNIDHNHAFKTKKNTIVKVPTISLYTSSLIAGVNFTVPIRTKKNPMVIDRTVMTVLLAMLPASVIYSREILDHSSTNGVLIWPRRKDRRPKNSNNDEYNNNDDNDNTYNTNNSNNNNDNNNNNNELMIIIIIIIIIC